ncbi:MAG: hypothetical protein K9L60_14325 [Methylovulum sp.]|jgi:hypothetical protein|nr:hypothetical protein [Methylovulum sp.]
MNTTLAKDLAESLKSYSIDVKHWMPGTGDSFIFLGNREFLQKHLADLTTEQLSELADADRRVIGYAEKTYDDDENDEDVKVLRMCSALIGDVGLKQAA